MKILIAEDDPIARMMLQNVLEKPGNEVISAENGQQAWEMINTNQVNMLITDLNMPEMDGVDLCNKIRETLKDEYIYIIMLTALDDKSSLISVFDSGADDYITKPFDPEELKARINTGVRVIELEQDHKSLQKIISSSRDKLKVILDSMNEEIISVDNHLTVISANKTFVRNHGYQYADLIGTELTQLSTMFDDPAIQALTIENIQAVFRGGQEKLIRTESGAKAENKRYRILNFLPVKELQTGVTQVVVVSSDITEQQRKTIEIQQLNKNLKDAFNQVNKKKKELEDAMAQLRRTQAQVLQSEKMASIGQLAAGVAHEINNPTGFVSSNLKTLVDYQEDLNRLISEYRKLVTDLGGIDHKQGLPASIIEQMKQTTELETEVDVDFVQEDVRELIQDCREGMDRIKKIVVDLKDFAHPGEDKLVLTNINQGLTSTLNVVNNELKYKATVTTHLGELPEVPCYPQQLNQVFMNILVNAAQAIETKGEITIRTEHQNSHVTVQISDTGSGIAEENISKIFDPFFTTKDVGKGTGLGMNIAYNIIEKHQGSIDVESTVGKGTAFTIKLPVENLETEAAG